MSDTSIDCRVGDHWPSRGIEANNSSHSGRDGNCSISNVNRGVFVHIAEMDLTGDRPLQKLHVVEDDAVGIGLNIFESVDMSNQEWTFEMSEGPLGFPDARFSLNKDSS